MVLQFITVTDQEERLAQLHRCTHLHGEQQVEGPGTRGQCLA